MKYLRDGFLYEHLPEATKLMNDEIERNISIDDFPVELDQKIQLLAENGTKKRLYIPRAAVIFICLMSMAVFTVAVDAASGGKISTVIKGFFGAEKVTDENRDMIGMEIINDTPLEVHYEKDWEKELCYAPEVLHPASITGFVVDNGNTPEVILSNGACVLFYRNENNGWNCQKGDTLRFEFEKYADLSGTSQKIGVGYILDGVMYEGEYFDETKGCYQLDVDREGIYCIYVINASSDSITLKESKIYLEEN